MTNMAMSVDFLSAFARLPGAQQRNVRSLIARFSNNPTASGLNYERINGARDPNMRSLRIDRGYRAIVYKPVRGDVHMLLWADKHDEAYQWATRRRCDVHPETGAVQVYLPQDDGRAEALQATVERAGPSGAFASLKDRELMRLGVPAAMLPEVRGIADESQRCMVERDWTGRCACSAAPAPAKTVVPCTALDHKGHRRVEKRDATVRHDVDWLRERHDWPDLTAIGDDPARHALDGAAVAAWPSDAAARLLDVWVLEGRAARSGRGAGHRGAGRRAGSAGGPVVAGGAGVGRELREGGAAGQAGRHRGDGLREAARRTPSFRCDYGPGVSRREARCKR